jgi:hypothetical protein
MARIARRGRIQQGQRSGRGVHSVGSIDVVLDQYRHAVEQPALRSTIQFGRDTQSVGIDFDYRPQRRIQLVDPRQVPLGQFARREAGKIGDGRFFEVRILAPRHARERGGRTLQEPAARHSAKCHAPDYRPLPLVFFAVRHSVS